MMGVWLVSAILLGFYALMMLANLYGWWKTQPFNPNMGFVPITPITVIVAARNEEQHIRQCVECLLEQDYPEDLLEIIVVDDHSTDQTAAIVAEYPIVKLLKLEAGKDGKKQAITVAVELAKGNLIVTTDADCEMGNQWLNTIAAYYERFKPKMIAAPVYFHSPKNPVQIWQTLDFAGLMGITAAGIALGFPQMCNGANLAYEKAVFEELKGFEGIDTVPTGDDILLMLKIHKAYPGYISFIKNREAIVFTQPQPTLKALWQQRLRWVSKSSVFPDRRITAVLVMAYLFNVWVLAMLMAAVFNHSLIFLTMGLFLAKMLLEAPILVGSLLLSRQWKWAWLMPWVQVLHMLYVVAIGPAALIRGYQWKGRRY